MKQTVHIFAKDARHFWPEITGVLAVTALFAWLYPHTWTPEVHTGPGMNLAQMAALVAALMPVSWWILITRVMQGENLVGDQQWWITKPYEWPQLLAAKVLFLAVFTALPLLIAQWVLLARAGFGVFGHLPGQGYDLLLLGMLLVLPVVALAAATSSFGKLTLTAFGVVVLLIGVFMLFAWMKTDSFSVGAPDYVMDLLFLAVAGAVVFAYARRRVVLMRCLLAAIFVAGIGASYLGYSATRIGEKYPAEGWAGLPLQLTLDSGRTATASVAPKWGGRETHRGECSCDGHGAEPPRRCESGCGASDGASAGRQRVDVAVGGRFPGAFAGRSFPGDDSFVSRPKVSGAGAGRAAGAASAFCADATAGCRNDGSGDGGARFRGARVRDVRAGYGFFDAVCDRHPLPGSAARAGGDADQRAMVRRWLREERDG